MQEANELLVPTLAPWETRLNLPLRIKFFLTGVLFPILCLAWIVSGGVAGFESPWQTGRLDHHIAVLVSYPAISPFFSLLLYCFIAMSVWCFRPDTFRFVWIRIGIYSGVVLSLMFNILLFYLDWFFPLVFAVIASPTLALVVWGIGLLIRKQFSIRYLIIVTSVCCIGLALYIPSVKNDPQGMGSVLASLAIAALLVVGSAATLGCVTFIRVSRVIVFQVKDSMSSDDYKASNVYLLAIAWSAWAAGLATSWKIALQIQAVEYAKLPTTDPNCYVSAAAARGHQRFVGAVKRHDALLVNLQMKRLKFLEFALEAALPRTHRSIRFVYNRLGPHLARVCRSNRWFADVSFVFLKPLEWVAEVLRWISGVSKEVVLELYVSEGDSEIPTE